MAACCRETVFLVSCILPRMRLLRSRSNALSLSLLLIPHRWRGEMRERGGGGTGGRGLLLITLGFVTFSIIQQTLDLKNPLASRAVCIHIFIYFMSIAVALCKSWSWSVRAFRKTRLFTSGSFNLASTDFSTRFPYHLGLSRFFSSSQSSLELRAGCQISNLLRFLGLWCFACDASA